MAEEDTADKALQEAHNVLESKIGDEGIVAMQAYIRQSEDRQTAALQQLESRLEGNMQRLESRLEGNMQRLESRLEGNMQRMEGNMQRLEGNMQLLTEKIDRNLRWTLMFVVAWTGVIFAALKLVG